MFAEFFLLLKTRGLAVTLTEWLTLQQGLREGLHQQSLTGFYQLARAVLVKSEKDFDLFDLCFSEFFGSIEETDPAFTEELLSWLDKPELEPSWLLPETEELTPEARAKVRKDLEDRLAEQDAEHNRGRIWIGTQGYSAFGNNGHAANGIRVGGEGLHRRAFQVAGERTYCDFRQDRVLDNRQFQLAFRALRQFSTQIDGVEPEFDADGTVNATAKSGGLLKVRYRNPRRNSIKLLLLMDSGGSMEPHARLCAQLFRAAKGATHFKDLKIYYFHNSPGKFLNTTPTLAGDSNVSTDWILNNYRRDYRVIFVGDAMMEQEDLYSRTLDRSTGKELPSGMEWLKRIRREHPHTVWLNPVVSPPSNPYWGASYRQIAAEIDMYPLTVEGLHQALKQLLVRR